MMGIHDLLRTASGTFQSLKGSVAAALAVDEVATPADSPTSQMPELLQWNWSLLSEEDRCLAGRLCEMGQRHLFDGWDAPGVNNHRKAALLQQLRDLDNSVIGGIDGYLNRARSLLQASSEGVNPLAGWRPEVPAGVTLTPFSDEFDRFELCGLPYVGTCGFVLVAGGLGERLGYSGVKIGLPVETVTHTSYLQLYASQILAMEKRYALPGKRLPLAIMVSADTHLKTEELLRQNHFFGLHPDQVTLLKQGLVPALSSNDARIALSSPYEVEVKPHGHGDVHALLHASGLARGWQAAGITHIVFFQDTNGLCFFTLPAMLGVSVDRGWAMNSLAVPRVAKQAMGALAKLTHSDGRHVTVNVEYNQLDPLLRATVSPEGDVNDPVTGRSTFPGNTNHLLFRLADYLAALDRCQGLMPEFVNPKYKDSQRQEFKKPTRLECMMQDFAKVLCGESKEKEEELVGYTAVPAWLCYSPCKNNAKDAAASIASGVPAASPYTAESDQYRVFARMLRSLGAEIPDDSDNDNDNDSDDEEEVVTVLGISNRLSPRIVIHPSCALFLCEMRRRFPTASEVRLSRRSSLVMDGDVVVQRLALDGFLKLSAPNGHHLIVKTPPGLTITNAGHEMYLLRGEEEEEEEEEEVHEEDRMRGYLLRVLDCQTCPFPLSQSNGRSWVYNGTTLIDSEAAAALEAEEVALLPSSSSSTFPCCSPLASSSDNCFSYWFG
eukprot:scaffold2066_cov229-Ochromonas_danica.AAC.24